MYRVIKYFTDLQDGDHPYNEGDVYPRKGLEVSEERFAELASHNNRRNEPLIKFVEEKPKKAPARKAKKPAEE